MKPDNNKINKEIITSTSDVLTMLDELLEKRDGEWWNNFYADRNRPVPFFKNIPDEELVAYCRENVFDDATAKDQEVQEKYAKEQYAQEQKAPECVALGHIVQARTALDIGCGNGRNTMYLAKQGYDAVGIDISGESVAWAVEMSKDMPQKPRFEVKSLFEFEAAENSFDLILDSGCFHHIKPHRRQEYLTKIRTMLKDDGYFLMTCFNQDGGADITDYDVYRDCSMHGGLGFSEEKIRTILDTYFDIQELRQMKESDNPDVFGKSFMWVIWMKKKKETYVNGVKYLYHGSQYLYDMIKPMQAGGENAECSQNGIYASDNFDYVIPFALPIRWYPDNPSGKWDFVCDAGRVKICQGTLNPNGVGYVYKVRSDHFKKIDNWQWVAYQEITPEEIIKIEVKDYMDRVTFSGEAAKTNDEVYGGGKEG